MQPCPQTVDESNDFGDINLAAVYLEQYHVRLQNLTARQAPLAPARMTHAMDRVTVWH